MSKRSYKVLNLEGTKRLEDKAHLPVSLDSITFIGILDQNKNRAAWGWCRMFALPCGKLMAQLENSFILTLTSTAVCLQHSFGFSTYTVEMCLNRKKSESLSLCLFIIPLLIFFNPSGSLFPGSNIHIRSALCISFPSPKASHWQHFTGNQQSGRISCLIIWCDGARGRATRTQPTLLREGPCSPRTLRCCVTLDINIFWTLTSIENLIATKRETHFF